MVTDGNYSTPAGRNGKGYFAVGADTFHRAVSLGLNPVCVFLTMARGTERDDVTTSWSAQAAAQRLGIRWTTARSALQELKRAKLVTVSRESTKPKYTLAKKGDAIILPNSLIDGVSGELPPLLRVRQMQDPLTFRGALHGRLCEAYTGFAIDHKHHQSVSDMRSMPGLAAYIFGTSSVYSRGIPPVVSGLASRAPGRNKTQHDERVFRWEDIKQISTLSQPLRQP